MPSISKEKKEKIQEQIVAFLFTAFPKQLFTSEISQELARDEEFIKKLLLDLEGKQLVIKILKNKEGIPYARRVRWRISNKAYDIYNSSQSNITKNQAILEKNTFE